MCLNWIKIIFIIVILLFRINHVVVQEAENASDPLEKFYHFQKFGYVCYFLYIIDLTIAISKIRLLEYNKLKTTITVRQKSVTIENISLCKMFGRPV